MAKGRTAGGQFARGNSLGVPYTSEEVGAWNKTAKARRRKSAGKQLQGLLLDVIADPRIRAKIKRGLKQYAEDNPVEFFMEVLSKCPKTVFEQLEEFTDKSGIAAFQLVVGHQLPGSGPFGPQFDGQSSLLNPGSESKDE